MLGFFPVACTVAIPNHNHREKIMYASLISHKYTTSMLLATKAPPRSRSPPDHQPTKLVRYGDHVQGHCLAGTEFPLEPWSYLKPWH